MKLSLCLRSFTDFCCPGEAITEESCLDEDSSRVLKPLLPGLSFADKPTAISGSKSSLASLLLLGDSYSSAGFLVRFFFFFFFFCPCAFLSSFAPSTCFKMSICSIESCNRLFSSAPDCRVCFLISKTSGRFSAPFRVREACRASVTLLMCEKFVWDGAYASAVGWQLAFSADWLVTCASSVSALGSTVDRFVLRFNLEVVS